METELEERIKKFEEMEKDAKPTGKQAILLASTSFAWGLTTGAIGKGIGGDYKFIIPIVPIGMDLTMGRGVNCYTLFYALGVVANYPMQIYETIKNLL